MYLALVQLLVLVLLTASRCQAQDNNKCPAGEHLVDGACELCPAGTYRQFIRGGGSSNDRECEPCPRGKFSAYPGAVAVDVCQTCPLDTFASHPGSTECTPCLAGHAAIGSANCISCEPGFEASRQRDGDSLCKPCRQGYYRDNSMARCRKCPSFTTTKGRGTTSEEECVPCLPGMQCFRCWGQQYRTSWNTTCRDCPSGTFSYNPDVEGISACKPCPVGTRRLHWKHTCKKCRWPTTVNGEGGMYCRTPGEACPDNFFETTSGNCRKCDPGYRLIKEEGRCEECSENMVSPGGLTEKCMSCPFGQVPSFRNDQCECPAGSFMRDANTDEERCVKCRIGTASSSSNRNRRCVKCTEGEALTRGSEECKPCAGDTAYNETLKRCTTCPQGYMPWLHGYERRECVNVRTRCPAGHFRTTNRAVDVLFSECREKACTDEDIENGTPCVKCKKGFVVGNDPWDKQITEKVCVECGRNETSEGGTSTECVPCPRDKERHYNSGKCVCIRGLVREDDGTCRRCKDGSWSWNGKTCKECRKGFFANADSITCRKCLTGFFADAVGTGTCKECPAGTRPNRSLGATACRPDDM